MKIFITGISSGIGKALAQRLVASGHQVWGLARRQELLEQLKKELGDKLSVSVCDISDRGQLRQMAQALRAANFIPDVCILNAGMHIPDVRGNFNDMDFQHNFNINLFGSLFWVSEFLPDFSARKHGSFIAVSSTSAYRPGMESVGYPASKAALSMAFRGLRLNYPQMGVQFITIHFGPINTQMWQGKRSFLIPDPSQAAAFIQRKLEAPSGSYFYPWLSTTLFRLTRFLPDQTFVFFGKILRKYRGKRL